MSGFVVSLLLDEFGLLLQVQVIFIFVCESVQYLSACILYSFVGEVCQFLDQLFNEVFVIELNVVIIINVLDVVKRRSRSRILKVGAASGVLSSSIVFFTCFSTIILAALIRVTFIYQSLNVFFSQNFVKH